MIHHSFCSVSGKIFSDFMVQRYVLSLIILIKSMTWSSAFDDKKQCIIMVIG